MFCAMSALAFVPTDDPGVAEAPSTSAGELGHPGDPSNSSPDTIGLTFTRFVPGEDTVLVSNGIPLPPGSLMPESIGELRVVINGLEQPAYIEALTGRHADGSVRSVLIQFRYPILGPNRLQPEVLLVRERDGGHAAPSVTKSPIAFSYESPLPEAVALPYSAEYLISTGFVGETVLAPDRQHDRYEENFKRWHEPKWQAYSNAWGKSLNGDRVIGPNFYDRVLIMYAWWARTGDPEYWKRAAIYLIGYRELYMKKWNYWVQPHNIQVEGLELHHLLTGDPESLRGVERIGEYYSVAWYRDVGNVNHNYLEGRIQARTLDGLMTAYRTGVTSKDFGALMRQALTSILQTQKPDGSYVFKNTCYTHYSYMTGLLNEVLIKYYTYVDPDARIPDAIKRSLDYMWQTQWLSGDGSFKYASGSCPGKAGPNPAPDLNLLIVGGYGWYARFSGDGRYREYGDQIFDAGVRKAFLSPEKQFNESYRSSFHYLAYRR
jgi:hypothetical protein